MTRAGTGAEEEYGFTINGLQIKTFNYVKSVIPKIYERMRSERIRIANRYESEGREREAKILGKMAKDLEKIESEGYAQAATIRGAADAEVLKVYAEAYGKDSEFYSFSRSLNLFPKTFSKKMRLVLSADEHDFSLPKVSDASCKSKAKRSPAPSAESESQRHPCSSTKPVSHTQAASQSCACEQPHHPQWTQGRCEGSHRLSSDTLPPSFRLIGPESA